MSTQPRPGRPRDPQKPLTDPDGGPLRRPGGAKDPINPEPEVPPPDGKPVPVKEPSRKKPKYVR